MALAVVYPIESDIASNVFVFIDFPFETLLTVIATLFFLEFFFIPFPIDIVLCAQQRQMTVMKPRWQAG